MRKLIETTAAPAAIGVYSQAIRASNVVYLSGQIALDPATMTLVQGDMSAQVRRIFDNMKAVTEAAGGSLNHVVKLTVFLLDLAHFDVVNEVMKQYFQEPYPARSLIGVAALPKQAEVEIEAIMAF